MFVLNITRLLSMLTAEWKYNSQRRLTTRVFQIHEMDEEMVWRSDPSPPPPPPPHFPSRIEFRGRPFLESRASHHACALTAGTTRGHARLANVQIAWAFGRRRLADGYVHGYVHG